MRSGFSPYTEFPDVYGNYSRNVLESFSQRLTKSERPDIRAFYDFWEIAPHEINDKFHILGHTQALLPTDNFELLADYNPVQGLRFLTDLAGLSNYKLPGDILSVGDELRFEPESNNAHDKDAVRVFKNQLEIGYIKQIHCKVFRKPGCENLKLTVNVVEKTESLRELL